jgi:hypothetical protein
MKIYLNEMHINLNKMHINTSSSINKSSTFKDKMNL